MIGHRRDSQLPCGSPVFEIESNCSLVFETLSILTIVYQIFHKRFFLFTESIFFVTIILTSSPYNSVYKAIPPSGRNHTTGAIGWVSVFGFRSAFYFQQPDRDNERFDSNTVVLNHYNTNIFNKAARHEYAKS